MQFTGHSLPVHQSMTVPSDFNCPILLAKPAEANGICNFRVFGMACLTGSKVNIQQFYCEKELKTEQNCNILNPITAFLSRSPGLLNRGPGGPASLRHVPHSSIFSPTGQISNCLIGDMRVPSAGCWFSLPHLISN